jgi:hypothetical protein
MADDTDNPDDPVPSIFNTPKGGLFGGPFDPSGLDANVRAEIMDWRWTTVFGGSQAATKIPYAFPTAASDYTSVTGYPATAEIATFEPLGDIQKAAVRTTFDLVASYTDLTFVEVSSGLASAATFRFAQYDKPDLSESRFPSNPGPYDQGSDSRDAGDTFLGDNADPPAAYFGTDDFATIVHEMGHAFGLKHGHDASLNGALAPQFNDSEFSVMTYASYLGANTERATAPVPGSAPQSFMMFDIAALQALYGANFSKAGTAALYTWDPVSGQESINGQPAPDTGASSTGKIFSTVWTMGAVTTYDLSGFGGNQTDDLRPGHWLTFSQGQLADLNSQAPGTSQARGNIYNALLYHHDLRSEVDNLITGGGNDTIWGNDVDNVLKAGAGRDTIHAGTGDDTISGGPDPDKVYFGPGHDILRDPAVDLNGDVVFDFNGSVDVTGVRFGAEGLHVADTHAATITADGATVQLNGDFSNGDFMIAERGSGGDAHTTVTFVPFLPKLAEAVSVDPATVNGIANQPFLTGDGQVHFSLDFKSAVSAFHNELGFYEVDPDGTIHGVHILFDNTLGVTPAQQTVDLGTPGNNERLGFFLIQDGSDIYGKLPDNLSFVALNGAGPADVDNGLPVLLHSATLGNLTAAQIFHSFANLNPNHADQVLSGLTPVGHVLTIGFEDLARATGDNDFQDVVIAIHVTPDDNRIM